VTSNGVIFDLRIRRDGPQPQKISISRHAVRTTSEEQRKVYIYIAHTQKIFNALSTSSQCFVKKYVLTPQAQLMPENVKTQQSCRVMKTVCLAANFESTQQQNEDD